MNPDLRNSIVALVGGIALLIATCDDLNSARKLAQAIFLDPERALSRPDSRSSSPEGLKRQSLEPFTKPEGGFPIVRPSSPER